MELNGMTAITAVIRTWNNSFITSQVKNLLDIGVGRVIVIINATPDNGSTLGFLSEIADPRLTIVEMREGYTWSNALNRALMIIHTDNLTKKAGCRFILNVSVEAQFNSQHLDAMLATMNSSNKIGIVGTSFEGIQDGRVISLGESYKHPRNTGMLIRVTIVGPGFDTYCDGVGGMEDIDFILRSRALYGTGVKRLDLRVPLIIGNNYHQATKELKEQEAMNNIVSRWRESLLPGTKERARIEECISQMGIASPEEE